LSKQFFLFVEQDAFPSGPPEQQVLIEVTYRNLRVFSMGCFPQVFFYAQKIGSFGCLIFGTSAKGSQGGD